ncbi:MAG: hypothetical protein K9M96_09090 [Deltaproteobacteria bacterium]|nr:hypothetical protein [Deltaproteobacteria bacterium]
MYRYVGWISFVCLMCLLQTSLGLSGEIQGETYQRLDNIRRQKKAQLLNYLDNVKKSADAIRKDPVMEDFFDIKNKYYQLRKTKPASEGLVRTLEALKQKINEHYLNNYRLFYDILFINTAGEIFYTIRKQADYHKNIFRGALSETALAQQLEEYPHETFVDYQYYDVSGEPSAFIVEPVIKDGRFMGWFVMQCAINKINNMFTHEKGLGMTGEVFLVNKENYMLTDSRFYGDSTILKRHLSRKNIEAKFEEQSGHKIVTDYRGFRALSSFEVCRIADSEWLLIAKIDEDEIITEQYKGRRNVLGRRLKDRLRKSAVRHCKGNPVSEKPVVVDMDEFRKVQKGEMIGTFGVSTCTALIISFPERFAYMGHISPLDRIYGGKTTDLISHMLKRIKAFDIYKYERRRLQATIVANHCESIIETINALVEEGFFLSQIKFIYNGSAEYGRVLHDYMKNETCVKWLMNRDTGEKVCQCASDVKSVGSLIKPVIGYE